MRRRKKHLELPRCVYFKHGAYYWVKQNKWVRLGSELGPALVEYARLISAGGGMVKLIDEVLDDASARVRPSTYRRYSQVANILKLAFREFSPDQVQPPHIYALMEHYKRTPNQANRMRTVLKMVFDVAVISGKCASNPVSSIPRYRERKRDRYLTDGEFGAIQAASSPALRAIIDIAYLTGQRIGDVLKIRLSDISPDGIAFRQEKTGARLVVAMNPALAGAIEAARALHPRQVTPVYLVGQRNGRIRSYRGVRDQWARAAAKAGVDDAHLHDIRAKSITDTRKQGHNPQALAGHTTAQQTVRYLRDKETPIVKGPEFKT